MQTSSTREAMGSIRAGDDFGASEWVAVTQEMIDGFGAVTLDPDPMHVDPQWAKANGPFGEAIAFGFLTMSLLTKLLHSAMGSSPGRDPHTEGYYLNYGFDRMRLVTPVLAGKRIRGHFHAHAVRVDERQRVVVTFRCKVEIEGEERPALIADWLTVWVPPET